MHLTGCHLPLLTHGQILEPEKLVRKVIQSRFGVSQMYYDIQTKELQMIKICVTLLENLCTFERERLQKRENGYKKRKNRSEMKKVVITTGFIFNRVNQVPDVPPTCPGTARDRPPA